MYSSMADNGGIIRTRRSRLSSDDLEKIDSALKDPKRYSSYETSALAAIIWLLFFSIIGLIAAATQTDWPVFTGLLKKSEFILSFYECPEGWGFIAAAVVIVAAVYYWLTIRGRFGYIVLPDAIGRVRGNRITIIPVQNIEKAVSNRIETYSDPMDTGFRISRSYSVVKLTMKNGKHFNLYAPKLDLSLLGDRLKKG